MAAGRVPRPGNAPLHLLYFILYALGRNVSVRSLPSACASLVVGITQALRHCGEFCGAAAGREAFLEEVFEYVEQYGGKICSQLRRMGASADWGRQVSVPSNAS